MPENRFRVVNGEPKAGDSDMSTEAASRALLMTCDVMCV